LAQAGNTNIPARKVPVAIVSISLRRVIIGMTPI
jgi:hypothetical protein